MGFVLMGVFVFLRLADLTCRSDWNLHHLDVVGGLCGLVSILMCKL